MPDLLPPPPSPLTAAAAGDYAVVSPHYSADDARYRIYYGYETNADAASEAWDRGDDAPPWAAEVVWGDYRAVVPPGVFGGVERDPEGSWIGLAAWLLSVGALRLDPSALDAALSSLSSSPRA